MTTGTPRTLLSVEPITFDHTKCQEKDPMQGFINKGLHGISKHFKNTCAMYVKFRLAYAAYASFISQKTLTQPYAHQSFAYAKDSYDKPSTKHEQGGS